MKTFIPKSVSPGTPATLHTEAYYALGGIIQSGLYLPDKLVAASSKAATPVASNTGVWVGGSPTYYPNDQHTSVPSAPAIAKITPATLTIPLVKNFFAGPIDVPVAANSTV